MNHVFRRLMQLGCDLTTWEYRHVADSYASSVRQWVQTCLIYRFACPVITHYSGHDKMILCLVATHAFIFNTASGLFLIKSALEVSACLYVPHLHRPRTDKELVWPNNSRTFGGMIWPSQENQSRVTRMAANRFNHLVTVASGILNLEYIIT